MIDLIVALGLMVVSLGQLTLVVAFLLHLSIHRLDLRWKTDHWQLHQKTLERRRKEPRDE